MRIVWQTVGRITYEIWWWKGSYDTVLKNLKNTGPASVGRKDDTFNCKAERSQKAYGF